MPQTAQQAEPTAGPAGPGAAICVAPAPHVLDAALTTRRMMLDVLIALVPPVVASLIVFRAYALAQIAVCVASCLAFEALFMAVRGKGIARTLLDGSAVVTGLIVALSLPGPAPWYVSFIGSGVAIGIGKVIFGGLGQNTFNPAMVGRAFVMIAFAGAMGASGYVVPRDLAWCDAVTTATPMAAAKGGDAAAPLWALFLGNTNGSLGETSALACLLGGAYLCLRRTASWEIPAGAVSAVAVIAGIMQACSPALPFGVLHHLLGGALLFGAFFIATDPVTSPLTPRGKLIYGVGIGALVMLFRTLSNYPEGVMFAVLIMNALTPLINRWAIPTPVGGPWPAPKHETQSTKSETNREPESAGADR